jgi:outer membrane protein OmpA-like peptidoglycan-associated protein
MKSSAHNTLRLATAILATCTAVPFLAQSSSNAQIQTGTSTSSSATSSASGDQTLSTIKPLDTKSHEGFWGHLNPMARKKWVNRQLNPVKDRLNELDEVTASNAREIKDVDARAQAGIQKADAAAQLADQHATQAGNTANQAQQLAQQADAQTVSLNNTVNNLDQYQSVSKIEIRFRNGQSVLGRNAREALDQLAAQIQGQRGYLIDVEGFSGMRGTSGVVTSHRMAEAVTRYLVTQHQVPLYRIHQIGLGNAPMDGSHARRNGSTVEVTLMHNSLSALSASNSGASTTGTAQPASSGTAAQPVPNQ